MLPEFLSGGVRLADWQVAPVPRRLRCRHVDLGDVSPANTHHFQDALRTQAQAVQVDLITIMF